MSDENPTLKGSSKVNPLDRFNQLNGERIDNYIIDRPLGVGGQAVVFLAHGTGTMTNYALKMFGLLGEPSSLEGGLQEAKNQSRIDHDFVVKVFEPGIAEIVFDGSKQNILYIPMQYAPLGSCKENPPFTDRELTIRDVNTMIDLLDGLNSVHQQNILHRDIKPANILRFQGTYGGKETIVLRITDFGIAKVLFAMTGAPEMASGLTPDYMSPEQLDRHPTSKSDIYSMGATLYYMLTGNDPIEAPSDPHDVFAWQKAHRDSPRPNPMDHNLYCPARLALLIMQMMSVEPDARPSLSQCIAVLEQYIETLEAKALGFNVPEPLKHLLTSDDPTIRYVPEFRQIFDPAVHLLCGTVLHVIRIQMEHPLFGQYKRLVEYLVKRFSDCFCMYETYGSYDIQIFLWSDPERVKSLTDELRREYAGSRVEISVATNVHHMHVPDKTRRTSITVIGALAIQSSVTVPELDSKDYLSGRYPEEVPEHSVRAFTYVDQVAARSVDASFIRVAIVESVRKRMNDIVARTETVVVNGSRKKRPRFPRLSIIELVPEPERPVVLVDYVASDFRHLYEVAAAVIDIGETAVKTSTFIETGRVVIQSDKILF